MDKIVLAGLATIVTSSIMLWSSRNTLIFFPEQIVDQNPSDVGVAYQDLYVPLSVHPATANHRVQTYIHGWFLQCADEKNVKSKLIIFSHGNAGNISNRLHIVEFFYRYMRDSHSLFMYDYLGYGKSSLAPSHPSVDDCKRSLNAVISFFRDRGRDYQDIILWGESIGGAITAVVASEHLDRRFQRIILQSTFTGLCDMAKRVHPIVRLLSMFCPEELDVVKACKRLRERHRDLVIMHSRSDDIVPFFMFEKLSRYASKTCELAGFHNDTLFDEQVARCLMT